MLRHVLAPESRARLRALASRAFHRTIECQTAIAAPPERVWQVLTEFASYPSWNPFLPSVRGEARPGAALRAVALPARGPGLRFTAQVTAAQPARELRWTGRFLFAWLFHGHHYFVIQAAPQGTLLRHGEVLGGVLVPALGAFMAAWMRPGFQRMNRALKARAEQVGRTMEEPAEFPPS